jgi:putative addiction module component (TIGR02574 family)
MTRRPKVSALLREALSLPELDRLALAAALIGRVDNGVGGSVDAAWAAEARRRLAEVRSGVVKPVPWEDAEKAIFDTE